MFPIRDTGADGYVGLAPVGCFEGNSFGLHDMVGNVWEWTSEQRSGSGLIKGGSYLCAMNYCANFRPAAFQAQELDLGTSQSGSGRSQRRRVETRNSLASISGRLWRLAGMANIFDGIPRSSPDIQEWSLDATNERLIPAIFRVILR